LEKVRKASFKVVGIIVEANWQDLHIEMPRTWKNFKNRIDEINNKTDMIYT
jgi:hypothetical protein